MKKLIALFFLLCLSARAQITVVTYALTVTNQPTNGETFTVQGITGTFTNLVANPLTQILSTNNVSLVASNILTWLGSIGNIQATFQQTATNIIVIRGNNITASFLTNWATLSSSSQTTGSGQAITLPITTMPSAIRTNLASLQIAAENAYSTNPISSVAPIASQLGGLTNTNIWKGPNIFLGPNTVANETVTNSTNINSIIGAATVTNLTAGSLTILPINAGSESGVLTLWDQGNDSFSQIYSSNDFIYANNATWVGNGSALTELSPANIASGIVSSSIAFTNGGNTYLGTFTNLQSVGTNTINAELVLKRYNNTGLANGVNQDVQLGTNCDTKLSGPTAAFSTAGFAAPNDDQFNFVQNSTAYQWTINNQSGLESTAANRIFTGTGADLVLSSNSWALFKYDASVQLWLFLFASGSPSSGGSGSFSGSFTGNGAGLTNVTATGVPVVNQGTTNANTLTSFTATFSTNFSDTNYTALAIGNGFALAGSYVSAKTISNCVFNMTVATGTIDWVAIHK